MRAVDCRVIFVFHKNSNAVRKAKVRPPRAQGKRLGLFATRSPHRPNPIGLSLAKIDKIEGSYVGRVVCLHVVVFLHILFCILITSGCV
jgi:tRNA (Thr-GGU) A37 N-methylase